MENEEFIILDKNRFLFGVIVHIGKQGDCYLAISPALAVSGYGKTKEDAEESFDYNLKLFHKEFMQLSLNERKDELRSLGWRSSTFRKKRYLPKDVADYDLSAFNNPNAVSSNLMAV